MIKLRIGKFRLSVCKKYADLCIGNRAYRHSFNKPVKPDTELEIIIKHYQEQHLVENQCNFSDAEDIVTIGCKKTTDNKTFGNYVVIPIERVDEVLSKLMDIKNNKDANV